MLVEQALEGLERGLVGEGLRKGLLKKVRAWLLIGRLKRLVQGRVGGCAIVTRLLENIVTRQNVVQVETQKIKEFIVRVVWVIVWVISHIRYVK